MASFLSSLDISVSGMIANRARLDVISHNVANADTVASSEEDVYKRQVTVFSENKTYKNIDISDIGKGSFSDVLKMTLDQRREKKYDGVVVSEIVEDETPATPVYDPSSPYANEDGYYYKPNVDNTEEQIDALAATQSYNANLTVFNTMKALAQKALTIGQN